MCLCHNCLRKLLITSEEIDTAFGKREIINYHCKKCGYKDFIIKSKDI